MIRNHWKIAGLSVLYTTVFAPFAANAADLYRAPPAPPPAYSPPAAYVETNSWAGFYAGINGGYGWGGASGTTSFEGDAFGRAQPQGGFGGGQIGYNFQSGSFVYGLETDFQGGDLSGRTAGISANGNDFASKDRTDWFGTARGRLGYSFGRTLIYGTGGFAYGDVRERAVDGGAVLAGSGTQTGWVAGGGAEYKITPAWSLKGEYQYIDLSGSKLTGLDATGAAASANGADSTFQTVRLGLNYSFGGGTQPLKSAGPPRRLWNGATYRRRFFYYAREPDGIK